MLVMMVIIIGSNSNEEYNSIFKKLNISTSDKPPSSRMRELKEMTEFSGVLSSCEIFARNSLESLADVSASTTCRVV